MWLQGPCAPENQPSVTFGSHCGQITENNIAMGEEEIQSNANSHPKRNYFLLQSSSARV